jgi:hypothetical protein
MAAAIALRISSAAKPGFRGDGAGFASVGGPSTSFRRMAPPGPEPVSVESAMPSSAARARAAGEAATPPGARIGGGGDGAGAGGGGASARMAGDGAGGGAGRPGAG